MRGSAREDLEDLVSTSLEKLHRVISRHSVDRVEAMLMTIGHRTLVDYWRRKAIENKYLEPLDLQSEEHHDQGADLDERLQDRRAEVRWVVLTFLGKYSPKCHALAMSYFAEEAGDSVAQRVRKRPDSIEREWRRCLARMVQSASHNPRSLLHELRQ